MDDDDGIGIKPSNQAVPELDDSSIVTASVVDVVGESVVAGSVNTEVEEVSEVRSVEIGREEVVEMVREEEGHDDVVTREEVEIGVEKEGESEVGGVEEFKNEVEARSQGGEEFVNEVVGEVEEIKNEVEASGEGGAEFVNEVEVKEEKENVEVMEEVEMVGIGMEKEVETEVGGVDEFKNELELEGGGGEEVGIGIEKEVETVVGGVDEFKNELGGGGEEFDKEVELKEEKESGDEVMEEVLTVEPKLESDVVGSMNEDVVGGTNEETEVIEEEHAEIKEDDVKVMEEIEKNETDAMEEVEEDGSGPMEEEVEEDESGPMEEVEKDNAEGESTGAEDEFEIAGIEKDGEGESIGVEEEDEVTAAEEDVPEAEADETPESVKSTGGKRKRGKNVKVSTRSRATRKTIEGEDVCFICFDGGELVLCDRRGCPKAYHASCVNRDEAFFQAKGRWNCGWHLCSLCQKDASVMCYTCTFSSCKSCLKDADMLCVKRTRGFCQTCMKTVMLIENSEKGNKEGSVDFDDKSSWEYLFKDYWLDLKAKHSLSLSDLIQDKSSRKGPELAYKQESPPEQCDAKDHAGSGSDNSAENLEASKKKKRKKKMAKSITKEANSSTAAVAVGSRRNPKPENTEWATEELLEFVMHMKNGDRSVTTQFEVQELLLEYIRINNLRDPKRKSQIKCDSRLENLFGKSRVAHFEMLKLIESHFLVKEDSQIDDAQGSVVDTEASQMDDDETPEALTKSSKARKRKARKKGDGRGPQFNREEYAAIDTHNISLIYLRRKLVEDLLEDIDNFKDKVVGTFVRIRILGTNQKQDLYRLVQVVGTSKAAEPYKIGKKTADITLEILNLNKTEVISIDTISNQEFTEDECKRLRQSIKCGLINRLTVGDILDKAMEVQAARVNDWLEAEILRLSHLRDRASDMGHRKELRESVEKLQILKTPEERMRRLEEVPTINADPKMDPSYESEDDTDKEEKKQEMYTRPRSSSFNRRGSDPVSPGKGDFFSKDSWNGTAKNLSKNWELSRNLSNKGFSPKTEDVSPSYERRNENSWNQGNDKINQQANIIEKPSSATEYVAPPPSLPAAVVVETGITVNEADKIWHYKDPAGKIQGPFSLVQLRKWSNNGYFPVDLRIWRVTDKEDDSILLTDALVGKFGSLKQRREIQETPSVQQSSRGLTSPMVDLPKGSMDGRNDSMNFPSPTPQQSTPGWGGGEAAAPYKGSSSFVSGDGGLQSPTPNTTLQRSSTPSSVNNSGSTVPNAFGDLGTSIPTTHDSSNSQSSQVVAVGPSNLLQHSQGHMVSAPDNNHMAAHMAQSISGQNSVVAHGWGGTPQTLQPNSSMNVAGQMVAYNQWTGAPAMVQNPAGVVPQPDAWGQAPIPNGQPNMQQAQQLPNVAWNAMQGNPNMGWVGNAPGNPNMNWGAMNQPGPTWVMPNGVNNVQVQGLMPGNMNGGWVAAPVGPPGVNVQGMPSNQGWVAAPPNNNQGWVATPGWGPSPPTGNGNPGWGPPPPTGNQGGIVQGPSPGNPNQGWGPPTGNQGAPPAQGPTPGNANQGWGPPAGNQGYRQQNRDDERGNRDSQGGGDRGRKPWNRDNRGSKDRNRERDGDRRSSFGRGGQKGDSKAIEPIVCPYFPNGRCKMGSNCRFVHK